MARLAINQSVGIGGQNNAADIKAVQQAINLLINRLPGISPLVVDGLVGAHPERSKTVAAIKVVQQRFVGMANPDGRVDVNGQTHRRINRLLASSGNGDAPVSAALRQRLFKLIKAYEGHINHLYLDTRGNPTIGEGHLVASIQEAQRLPFKDKTSQQPATAQQIAAEYEHVSNLPYGQDIGAAMFEKFTQLMLSDDDIHALSLDHITRFTRELEVIYGKAELASYPEDVKLALFDMVFNLGATKLKNEYIRFGRCIRARDFAGAARESHRNGIPAKRNIMVRNLLMGAAQ